MSANQFVNYKITTLRVSETWPDHYLSHVLEMRSQLISFCTNELQILMYQMPISVAAYFKNKFINSMLY